jgi:hypothetical protein
VNYSAVCITQQPQSGVVNVDGAREPGKCVNGWGHVRGVECAGYLKRAMSGLLGRVGRKRLELFECSRHDDLPGAVLVCRGEAHSFGGSDDLVTIAPEHCCHTGGRNGRCRRHRITAFADEDHGLLSCHDACADSRGDLADAVACTNPNLAVRLAGMWEKGHQCNETGSNQKGLSDSGIADSVRVTFGSVLYQVDTGNRG